WTDGLNNGWLDTWPAASRRPGSAGDGSGRCISPGCRRSRSSPISTTRSARHEQRTVGRRTFDGDPCEGAPHARLGEGLVETRPVALPASASASAPPAYSTACLVTELTPTADLFVEPT